MKPILLAVALATIAACESPKQEVRAPSPAPASAPDTIYKKIALQHASAPELANTLRSVVVTSSGGPAPQIVADQRTNSVVVTCAQSQLASIERLIRELDVPVEKP